MACSSGCPTPGAHATWGECMRAKSLRVSGCGVAGSDTTAQRRADKNLDDYARARSYGIQPKSTRVADVQHAIRASEQSGTAFQA